MKKLHFLWIHPSSTYINVSKTFSKQKFSFFPSIHLFLYLLNVDKWNFYISLQFKGIAVIILFVCHVEEMRRQPYDIDHEDYAIVHKNKSKKKSFSTFICFRFKQKVHEISICVYIIFYKYLQMTLLSVYENEQFKLNLDFLNELLVFKCVKNYYGFSC